MLLTNLLPAPGGNYHGSTAYDPATPRLADGSPALRDAWRYIAADVEESNNEHTNGAGTEARTSGRAANVADSETC
jgi:hypothetical protein